MSVRSVLVLFLALSSAAPTTYSTLWLKDFLVEELSATLHELSSSVRAASQFQDIRFDRPEVEEMGALHVCPSFQHALQHPSCSALDLRVVHETIRNVLSVAWDDPLLLVDTCRHECTATLFRSLAECETAPVYIRRVASFFNGYLCSDQCQDPFRHLAVRPYFLLVITSFFLII
jgi:hypothetical protein